MTRWTIVRGAAALSFFATGCSKLNTSSEDVAPGEPVAAPSTPPPAIAAPESGPMTTAAAATPAPKRLAPDGTFFLLAKKSVETDAGILGLRPGTRVARREDGKFLAEGNVVELQPNEITNDLEVAARVAGADTRAQAAIRQTLTVQRARSAGGSTSPPSSETTANSLTPASDSAAPISNGRSRSGLGGSSSLGSAHTRTKDGWLWEKNGDGEWEKVRRLR